LSPFSAFDRRRFFDRELLEYPEPSLIVALVMAFIAIPSLR
jgi:hypothetical protein